MSAFFLFDNVKVRDPHALERYVREVAPVVEAYGGRYRSVGGPAVAVEGEWTLTYPVIIEFETVDMARAWYESESYKPLKALRQSAVDCNGVLIEGL